MIEIVPYRTAWRSEFEARRGELEAVLAGLALRVDHIGSTAVPGLAAKDVIDVQVTVASLDASLACLLETAGFRPVRAVADHVPPGQTDRPEEWAKLLYVERPGERRTNIHVRVTGRANQRYALLMRDHLRARPAIAEAYAELKRRLAVSLADPSDYPEVKDPAVDLIYLAAEEWATATGWRVPLDRD